MDKNNILRLKESVDIAHIIGQEITLTKKGEKHWGCCPFHEEKTPSFMVSPADKSFYCYGCQAKGDVFEFLMKYKNIKFSEALKIVSEIGNVELTPFSSGQKIERNPVLDTNNLVSTIYQRNMSNSPSAQDELKKRKISNEMKELFRIGYANEEWNQLKTIDSDDLLKSNLLIQKADGKKFEFYRNRLMFPIINQNNDVIGFSGRIIEGDGPKYLNNRESDIFKKGECLYGIHCFVPNNDFAILVEGQIDVIAMHQAGFKNTLASLGTAFTREHAKKIKSIASKVIILTDGDNAGREAIPKIVEQCTKAGLFTYCINLPEGEDPDSMLASNQKINPYVHKNAIEYLLSTEDDSKRLLIAQDVFDWINQAENELFKGIQFGKLANILNSPISLLDERIRRLKS